MFNSIQQMFPSRVSKEEFLDQLLAVEGQDFIEQLPTKLVVGLSCAQTRTFPAYSIKLQSGSVSFYNIQEVTVGSTVVETTFVEGKKAKVVVNPGELQSGSWLRTADLKVQVDGSSYFTIPPSVSTETLVVKSLEGTSEDVWSRGGCW